MPLKVAVILAVSNVTGFLQCIRTYVAFILLVPGVAGIAIHPNAGVSLNGRERN